MSPPERPLVLGARGMVGSSLVRALKARGQCPLAPSRQELDLKNQAQTRDYFRRHRPTHVFQAAAKVGGILANNTYRADFILDNLTIQNNAFEAALETQVERFLFLGSSCIYPRECPQPMQEQYLLTGPLEATNEPYAVAKIAGLKTAENIRRQHGRCFFSVMPTNLYGEGDNFHPENSHVIPGLIARMEQARQEGRPQFPIWGSGRPRREFLYVDDLAQACLLLMQLPAQPDQDDLPHWINVGAGEDLTIAELAEKVAKAVDYQGELIFDSSRPDGTPRKLLDVSKIQQKGWRPQISLAEGLKKTVTWYRQRHEAS